jgi:hypothetical protein
MPLNEEMSTELKRLLAGHPGQYNWSGKQMNELIEHFAIAYQAGKREKDLVEATFRKQELPTMTQPEEYLVPARVADAVKRHHPELLRVAAPADLKPQEIEGIYYLLANLIQSDFDKGREVQRLRAVVERLIAAAEDTREAAHSTVAKATTIVSVGRRALKHDDNEDDGE